MPAPTPKVEESAAAMLAALGQRLRARRKGLGVTATAAAEAAGMSRVTLHRIERGEPSVAMGAYLSAIDALGLKLELADPRATVLTEGERLPAAVRLALFPQLKRLAWQLHGVSDITPREAFDLYERNWRHVDREAMDERERQLLQTLVNEFGGGRLLV